LPGGGQGCAGGEVAGRQRGRDRRPGAHGEPARAVAGRGGAGGGRGERVDVGRAEVVHVVHARGPELGGERDAAAAAELVAVHPQPEAGRGAGVQHPGGLGGVEGAILAEHVDPAHVRGDGGEHLPGDQLDVLLGARAAVPAVVLPGHQVRAEEGRLVELPRRDQGGGELGGAELVRDGEPVAGLGLQAGGAAGDRFRDPSPHQGAQALVGGGAGGVGGDADPAGAVGLSGHAGLELGGAVAVEDEVAVGVDPAGQHGATAEVLGGVGGRRLGGRAGPGDPAVLDHQGGVAQHLVAGDLSGAGGVVEGGVEGPQLGDAGEQGRCSRGAVRGGAVGGTYGTGGAGGVGEG